jgi:hypothetical protein
MGAKVPGMTIKDPGRNQWIAAAVLASTVLTVCFIRLGQESPAWGTDFWQRVLVSLFGTLGALVVAVVAFRIKRVYDLRDEDAKKAADERHRLESDLLGELSGLAETKSWEFEPLAPNVLEEQLKRFVRNVEVIKLRSTDKQFQALCNVCMGGARKTISYNFYNGDNPNCRVEAGRWAVGLGETARQVLLTYIQTHDMNLEGVFPRASLKLTDKGLPIPDEEPPGSPSR